MDIKDASAYFNLGVAYVRQGKLDKAIEALQRSIELALSQSGPCLWSAG